VCVCFCVPLNEFVDSDEIHTGPDIMQLKDIFYDLINNSYNNNNNNNSNANC
jgi:hypothetical protein